VTNSFVMLINYFSEGTRPVKRDEFRDFWGSLSMDERDYFRNVDLETGLTPKNMPARTLQFIEKTCSVCGKISADSAVGYYHETHNVEIGDTIKVSLCNIAGLQYWQYTDGFVEIRNADGDFVKVVD